MSPKPNLVLPVYVRQIHQVYGAIAQKIEELLVLLNEVKQQDVKPVKELSEKINTFLKRLEQSVEQEWASASRSVQDERKKKRFLESISRELGEIRQLEAYVALAARKPQPEIIRKIHALYKAVDVEMKEQGSMAA